MWRLRSSVGEGYGASEVPRINGLDDRSQGPTCSFRRWDYYTAVIGRLPRRAVDNAANIPGSVTGTSCSWSLAQNTAAIPVQCTNKLFDPSSPANKPAMDLIIPIQAIAGLLGLIIICNLWLWRPRTKKQDQKQPPEPAGAWPIIGHLHLLMGPEQLGRTFAAMADKYGPIFKLRFGIHRLIVVNNWELAKECLSTNDQALASRPSGAFAKYSTYDYAVFGFANGTYWREIRKIAMQELLSNHRLEMLKNVKDVEINVCVKELYRRCVENRNSPVMVEMKQWFMDLTFNVVVVMIAGKRYFGSTVACEGEVKLFREAIHQFFYLAGVFVPSDALPFLEWVDLKGRVRAMKKAISDLDPLVSRWVEEHRRKKKTSGKAEDFIDVMLSIVDSAQISRYDPDTIIKATAVGLITGATDTTSVAVTWTLALLLNHRHVLKKAQEELEFHVGKDRQVNESDIKNLAYLQATVKESLRLYPAGPLTGVHEAIEDCHISGFHVPAGTRLLVNIWKIQRDPSIWSNPTEYIPERFLTTHADVDVKGQHFECIPFGSGRRSCPGISFALQVMHLTLARLLHGFDMATPNDLPVDMTESAGLTMPKATPLEVLFTPRLPSKVYE